MTPVIATSNVESVMLGVVGSLVASVVFLLVFRWSTRPKIKLTATPNDDGTWLRIANTSRRPLFDVQVRADAVMWDGAMGTTYRSARPLRLSETTIPVLHGVRRMKKVRTAPGRRRVVDVSPASQAEVNVEPCVDYEELWVTVSAVDSVSGVRRAVSSFPLGDAMR
ncbi:MAG: hypothetical protein ABMA25_02315 [Ilumatobacteraceae bacterium]